MLGIKGSMKEGRTWLPASLFLSLRHRQAVPPWMQDVLQAEIERPHGLQLAEPGQR